MITKTFICDKCKKSVGEFELLSLKVTIREAKPTSVYARNLADSEKDICKECLVKTGMIPTNFEQQSDKDEASIANKKTLDTKLIEILEDLGVQFCE